MFRPRYLLVVCVFANVSALAADEDHADFLHTCLARKVLAEDPQLSAANVGVRVKGRIAVLWGPVPTPMHAQRAVAVLKAQPEFIEVRNELVIVPDDDPWAVAVTKLDHAKPRSSGVLAGRIENERPAVLKRTEPGKPLEQRVRELRESRVEYRSLAVTFEGANVTVTAPPDAGESLQAFLRELSRLPGVERVLLNTN